MTALLDVRRLKARYGPIVAVREIEFHVDEGEIVALLGANGAGKTTTLSAITGLVSCEGEILFAGEDISRLTPERVVRKGVSLTPEGRRVFAGLTVAENLALGAAARRDDDVEARRRLNAKFTKRELDVLRLLAEGHDTATLADRLTIAPHTVEWHVRHVIEKLGVHSKLQAVIAAARLGLIEI